MFILELFEIDWVEVFAKVYGLLRKVLFLIDSLGLTFIDDAYNLMISAITAFDGDEIANLANDVAKNCYIIIGIFALFRIALLLVNTIIDPDKLTDKSQGVGNILVRLVITLVLFVMVPFIFDMSRELQSEIINNNYIPKVIIGNDLTGGTSGNPGTVMKDIAVRSLIYPDPLVYDQKTKTVNSTCTGNCQMAVKNWEGNASFEVISYHLPDYVMNNGSAVYILKYTPIIVLLVGAFITYVLFSFAIDIALRSVELAVLEILAPMFLVTYVDPKSSASGPFKKWLTACGKTYLNLFIKIVAICIMLLFISKLNVIFKTAGDSTGLLQLLVYIAILLFAKKAPKWLGDLLGVDGSSLGGLGIGKKLGEAALIGGAVTKGIGAAKKWGTNKARRVGAGAVNRIGANIGGTIGGLSAARQNALGDTSLRKKREQALKETGSRLRANNAAMKSFFNKADRTARKNAINQARKDGKLNYAKQANEARMNARVDATNAALNGKFVTPLSLGQAVKKQYDSGYKTHDEKVRAAAEARFYANNGAFNMSDINYQKKLKADLEEASKILGCQTYANHKGEIYTDPSCTMPALYNEKTIKKFAGEHVTSYVDLGAVQITGGPDATGKIVFDKDVVVAKQTSTVMVESNGKLVEATVEPGTMLKQSVDSKGKTSYAVLMTDKPVTDKNGNVVQTGGSLSTGGNVESTANGGYVVRNRNGDIITEVTIDATGEVTMTNKISGKTSTGANLQEAIQNMAYENIGGKESTTAKNLDAAFASAVEVNASKFISYQQKISEANSHIVELQAKRSEQINLQKSTLDSSEYGLAIGKISESQSELKNINGELSIIDNILSKSSGAPRIKYNGVVYDIAELKAKKSELSLTKEKYLKTIADLRAWEKSAVGQDAHKAYVELEEAINSNLSAIDEQIRGEKSYISGIEAEKRKICKDVAPIMFDNKEVTSANYESLSIEISKDKEKKEKIAKGSLGVPINSSDKKD